MPGDKCSDCEHKRDPAFVACDCRLAMCFFFAQVRGDVLVIDLHKALFVVFAFAKCEVFDNL